jgi:hypothetical protein
MLPYGGDGPELLWLANAVVVEATAKLTRSAQLGWHDCLAHRRGWCCGRGATSSAPAGRTTTTMTSCDNRAGLPRHPTCLSVFTIGVFTPRLRFMAKFAVLLISLGAGCFSPREERSSCVRRGDRDLRYCTHAEQQALAVPVRRLSAPPRRNWKTRRPTGRSLLSGAPSPPPRLPQ